MHNIRTNPPFDPSGRNFPVLVQPSESRPSFSITAAGGLEARIPTKAIATPHVEFESAAQSYEAVKDYYPFLADLKASIPIAEIKRSLTIHDVPDPTELRVFTQDPYHADRIIGLGKSRLQETYAQMAIQTFLKHAVAKIDASDSNTLYFVIIEHFRSLRSTYPRAAYITSGTTATNLAFDGRSVTVAYDLIRNPVATFVRNLLEEINVRFIESVKDDSHRLHDLSVFIDEDWAIRELANANEVLQSWLTYELSSLLSWLYKHTGVVKGVESTSLSIGMSRLEQVVPQSIDNLGHSAFSQISLSFDVSAPAIVSDPGFKTAFKKLIDDSRVFDIGKQEYTARMDTTRTPADFTNIIRHIGAFFEKRAVHTSFRANTFVAKHLKTLLVLSESTRLAKLTIEKHRLLDYMPSLMPDNARVEKKILNVLESVSPLTHVVDYLDYAMKNTTADDIANCLREFNSNGLDAAQLDSTVKTVVKEILDNRVTGHKARPFNADLTSSYTCLNPWLGIENLPEHAQMPYLLRHDRHVISGSTLKDLKDIRKGIASTSIDPIFLKINQLTSVDSDASQIIPEADLGAAEFSTLHVLPCTYQASPLLSQSIPVPLASNMYNSGNAKDALVQMFTSPRAGKSFRYNVIFGDQLTESDLRDLFGVFATKGRAQYAFGHSFVIDAIVKNHSYNAWYGHDCRISEYVIPNTVLSPNYCVHALTSHLDSCGLVLNQIDVILATASVLRAFYTENGIIHGDFVYTLMPKRQSFLIHRDDMQQQFPIITTDMGTVIGMLGDQSIRGVEVIVSNSTVVNDLKTLKSVTALGTPSNLFQDSPKRLCSLCGEIYDESEDVTTTTLIHPEGRHVSTTSGLRIAQSSCRIGQSTFAFSGTGTFHSQGLAFLIAQKVVDINVPLISHAAIANTNSLSDSHLVDGVFSNVRSFDSVYTPDKQLRLLLSSYATGVDFTAIALPTDTISDDRAYMIPVISYNIESFRANANIILKPDLIEAYRYKECVSRFSHEDHALFTDVNTRFKREGLGSLRRSDFPEDLRALYSYYSSTRFSGQKNLLNTLWQRAYDLSSDIISIDPYAEILAYYKSMILLNNSMKAVPLFAMSFDPTIKNYLTSCNYSFDINGITIQDGSVLTRKQVIDVGIYQVANAIDHSKILAVKQLTMLGIESIPNFEELYTLFTSAYTDKEFLDKMIELFGINTSFVGNQLCLSDYWLRNVAQYVRLYTIFDYLYSDFDMLDVFSTSRPSKCSQNNDRIAGFTTLFESNSGNVPVLHVPYGGAYAF